MASASASVITAPPDAGSALPQLYKLSGAGFSAGGTMILPPLDLSIPAGRFVALLGHNGSGKSTLLSLLARQVEPTAGSIAFAGRPLTDYRTRDFARLVGWLPQQPPPADTFTVEELTRLGRYPWRGAFSRHAQHDRHAVAEALAQVGLEAMRERPVASLSGGERQRAWLAMMLAQEPRCLLLDEPTAALDIAHQLEVLQLLVSLRRNRGLSIIMAIHDLGMAARFADHLIALRQGHVISQGPPGALLRPDILGEIYGVPIGTCRPADAGRTIVYPL